jgi:hypothetical protein
MIFGSFYPWVVIFLVLGFGVHVAQVEIVVIVLNFGVIRCALSFGCVFPKFSYVGVSCAFGSLNQEKIMKKYLYLLFLLHIEIFFFSIRISFCQ